jgi:hypothetical protein
MDKDMVHKFSFEWKGAETEEEAEKKMKKKRDYHLGILIVEGQIELRAKCFQVSKFCRRLKFTVSLQWLCIFILNQRILINFLIYTN